MSPSQNSPLDRAVVEQVAQLARLELTASELDQLQHDLAQVLQHVAQLEQVSTADVPPLDHAADLTDCLRDDEVTPSLPREAALQNAPAEDGQFFLVPEVFPEQQGS